MLGPNQQGQLFWWGQSHILPDTIIQLNQHNTLRNQMQQWKQQHIKNRTQDVSVQIALVVVENTLLCFDAMSSTSSLLHLNLLIAAAREVAGHDKEADICFQSTKHDFCENGVKYIDILSITTIVRSLRRRDISTTRNKNKKCDWHLSIFLNEKV